MIAEALKPYGFTNIVGFDVSPGMLEVASDKGIYAALEEYELGDPDQFPDQYKNKFDCVVCAGLINNNHLDYRVFEEMTYALKKGGYAIFAARFSYMGSFWYNEVL